MARRQTGTREEWRTARVELLRLEKEHTRRSDQLARMRRELPWVRIDKPYTFETDDGTKTLAQLFDGRSQLLVYHFMFGPNWDAGCVGCSMVADHFDGGMVHLASEPGSVPPPALPGGSSSSPRTPSRSASCPASSVTAGPYMR
jgi:predicted dithiol-disulfide oxidoreductase (DUF899 family)